MHHFKLALSITALAAAVFTACQHDTSIVPSCNVPNPEAISYSGNIKAIVDKHCISCHNGSGNGPGNFRTYDGVKPYLANGTFSSTVVVRQSMPPAGPLPQSQIDSINCWLQSGYIN